MVLVLKKALHPSFEYLTCILIRCRNERKCQYTLKVHAYMRKCGLETHNVLGNYLVLMLVEVGSMQNAQQVFERLECRDELSWNSLITGLLKCGEPNQAFMLYEEMQEDGGLHPNGHTFVALLKACTKLKDLERGEKIHAEAAQSGLLERDPFVSSTLLDMYLKCGSLAKAKKLFDEKLVQDVISWTALITAYVKDGQCEEALYSFENMQRQGVSPDAVTFICSLKACGSLGAIDKGCMIHANIEKKGLLQRDLVVGTALVDMYAKCGLLAKAKETFDKLPLQTAVSWNALISGYIKHGFGAVALTYFDEMLMKGVSPDAVTFICALKACGSIGDIDKGQKLHEEVERQGLLESDLVVGNAVMDMYAKCGWLAKAQRLFDILPMRSTVSWNALIAGYAEHGFGDEALDCFKRMEHEGMSPDPVTFACSLKACSSAGAILEGQEIHVEIARRGLLGKDPVIGNSLVDMYAKSGWLAKAQEVFDKLPFQNVVSWNALISGYVEHGCDKEALNCYERMRSEGVLPDSVTLVCCLKACGSVGDTDKGSEIHDEIVTKGLLKSHVDVGNTLVDMYTKFGWHAKAQQIFDSLPVRDMVSWNAILAGYSKHGHTEEALKCFEQMQLEGIPADAVTLVASLKACAHIRASKKGQELHSKIRKGVFEKDLVVGTALVDLYAKCGLLDKARQVFDNLPIRDAVAWNALISGYADRGNGEDALKYYEQMQLAGVSPNVVTLVCSLKACGIVGAINKGLEIHAEISRKNFLERDLVGNTLVDMYAKCGLLQIALEVFKNIPVRDVVSWNALIAGFAEHRYGERALYFFYQMQCEGISSDAVTFVCSLKACCTIEDAIIKGREIHIEIVQKGFETEVLVSSTLVNMYAKSGLLAEAQSVFDMLAVPNVVLCNALMSGYVEHGSGEEALNFFERMQQEFIPLNAITFIFGLKSCSNTGATIKGQEIHADILKKGLESDLLVGSSVVDMYAKCGALAEAHEVFDKLPVQDVVSWTALMVGYAEHGHDEEVLDCYEQMQHDCISSNAITCVFILKACGNIGSLERGLRLHADIVRKGLECELLVGNTLVEMYAKFSLLITAQSVFDKLPVQDPISWNALISGYVEHGVGDRALMCLEQTQLQNIYVNAITLVCTLKACAITGATVKGQSLHVEIMKRGLEGDKLFANTLIDTYAKCGLLTESQVLFKKLPAQDVVSWTALISGYAQLGQIETVFNLLDIMIGEGIKPNHVTCIGVLNACSHAGLLNEGCMFFEAISNQLGLTPTVEHYTCMVDLLGRVGLLEKALAIIWKMPLHPDIMSWQKVLGACRKWGDVELGRQAYEHALRLDERGTTAYVCMSNIFADAKHK